MLTTSSNQCKKMNNTYEDVPMQLDPKHQPLDFGIYLSQLVRISRATYTLYEEPYTFKLEKDALKMVEQLLKGRGPLIEL